MESIGFVRTHHGEKVRRAIEVPVRACQRSAFIDDWILIDGRLLSSNS